DDITILSPDTGSSLKVTSVYIDSEVLGKADITLDFETNGSLIWKCYNKTGGGNDTPNWMPISVTGSVNEGVRINTTGISSDYNTFVIINFEEVLV
ncbi:unnamed protein product, partial [marine sediment metagenome]